MEGYKSYYGLRQREADKKLNKYGLNVITQKKKNSAIKILLQQFSNFMVLILLAATVISAFMGEITEAVAIIVIVVVNAILGFIQEYKTEKTMEALRNLAAPAAKVIREGEVRQIPAEEIVPEDLIVLEAGDRVPADAVVIETNNLQVDESLLTGESIPVEKESTEAATKKQEYYDKANSVYMGTIVTNGKAKAVVYSTGMYTEMGKIADMIQNIEDEQTALQRRLDHLGKFIVYGCLIICTIVSIVGILRGENVITMLLAGITLAVAAIPEGLPAVVTIALALGVQRMLKRNALVRRLPAVETLGCASIICSDKTGTLTQNKMTVRRIYTQGRIIEVADSKHNSKGSFFVNGKEIDAQKMEACKRVLEIGSLCNNARLSRVGQNEGRFSGDPTEGAILIAAGKGRITQQVLNKTYLRVDEIPFDSNRKCMSVICNNNRGKTFVFTKGAPDIIIDKCSRIFTPNGINNLNSIHASEIIRVNDRMAGNALRVLAVAYKNIDGKKINYADIESDLIFVGLIGIIDPPRKEVFAAVKKCKMAGIKPVMITGDHKLTAAAIAKELDIYIKGEKVLTGAELEKMNAKQLERAVQHVSVYARVSPKNKLSIVRALKGLGCIVAMTGDGVNDAPAVKEADIGISMGITGTDVTKEASSVILMDDNFATIVAAVEEGRAIYDNIRKFIRYLLSCNIGEVLTMFFGMILGLPIPLLPIQILWVNLVTDGLPAIALGVDSPERDIMLRPPRGSSENFFSNGLLYLIILRGILISASTLAVFTSVLYFTGQVNVARTAAFVTLVITQLVHVFECKSERKSIFEIPLLNNMFLVFAVACSIIMILIAVYIPSLNTIFRTVPLTLNEWILIIGFSSLAPVLSSFLRRKGS